MKAFNILLNELKELEDIHLYDESKNDNEPAITKNKAMATIEAETKKLGLSYTNYNTGKRPSKPLQKLITLTAHLL